jgi:mRNA interferase RelE/StbE
MDAAARELRKLDKPVARRISQRINWLAENLDDLQPEALSGDLAGLFKMRAGDYRILYEILNEEQTIIIHLIGHRREIYRSR